MGRENTGDRLQCPRPELANAGPHYCPQCRTPLTEYLWVYQTEWFCSERCAQGQRGRVITTPRNQAGAIDWQAYYEGYYGVAS